jgi:hypothetical protein
MFIEIRNHHPDDVDESLYDLDKCEAASHEAGHVTVAAALGHQSSAWIAWDDGGWHGRATLRYWVPDDAPPTPVPDLLKAAHAVAGPIAERLADHYCEIDNCYPWDSSGRAVTPPELHEWLLTRPEQLSDGDAGDAEGFFAVDDTTQLAAVEIASNLLFSNRGLFRWIAGQLLKYQKVTLRKVRLAHQIYSCGRVYSIPGGMRKME